MSQATAPRSGPELAVAQRKSDAGTVVALEAVPVAVVGESAADVGAMPFDEAFVADAPCRAIEALSAAEFNSVTTSEESAPEFARVSSPPFEQEHRGRSTMATRELKRMPTFEIEAE